MGRNTKHVGQIINTQKRCIVVFREVPDEPNNCLVVDTDSLPDWMHDDLINAVDSPGAQSSTEFYEYAQRQAFTDGTNMLNSLHSRGCLQKQSTDNVSMTPNAENNIRLDELNTLIREQNSNATGVKPSADTSTAAIVEQTPVTPAKEEQLDDVGLAKNLLLQARTFDQEAKALKEQAYTLAPQLKPGRKTPSKTAA